MSKILYLTLSVGVLSCSTAMAMDINNDDAFKGLGRRMASQPQFFELGQGMSSQARQAEFNALEQRMNSPEGQELFRALEQARQARFSALDHGMSGAVMQAVLQAEYERRKAAENQRQVQEDQIQAERARSQVAESQRQALLQADIACRQAEESQRKAEYDHRQAEESQIQAQIVAAINASERANSEDEALLQEAIRASLIHAAIERNHDDDFEMAVVADETAEVPYEMAEVVAQPN